MSHTYSKGHHHGLESLRLLMDPITYSYHGAWVSCACCDQQEQTLQHLTADLNICHTNPGTIVKQQG